MISADNLEQAKVPRAKGGGHYDSSRMRVLLECVEGALYVCPRSDKMVQFRLQQAWVLVRHRLNGEEHAAQVAQGTLFSGDS